ncbi:MAG: ATP-grasp domain-containing protein [Caldilineaceae bacterium]|nr:ATP-grasp domain-containing protein [Caldilineaceae bacterium]
MTTTILCLASYFKGGEFIEECKAQGVHTVLVTTEDLQHEPWPRHAIDEFFAFPGVNLSRRPDIIYAVSYLARERQFDQIIALDDYDVETVADLREHLRIPGMGATTARYFRDKLAMRVQARDRGIAVPEFVHVLNYDKLRNFMQRVPPPWVLKPRSEAGSMGIKKIHSADELWANLDHLGDRQSYYVLEDFLPGDVYHVDSIISEREIVFAASHKYGMPPMSVYQGGGVFVTGAVPYGGEEDEALQAVNARIMEAFGMVRGVTHAEYIRSHADGRFYFLEIAARVGGAGTDKLVEAEAGFNLWREWAKLEVAELRGEAYEPPVATQNYAALMVCLAKDEWPDTSQFDAPEIAWRMPKKHHVGMVAASPDYDRVQALVAEYVPRLADHYVATAPPMDSPGG